MEWHLEPTFIVQREPNKFHPYWLIDPISKSDFPLLVDFQAKFENAQERLIAHYNSDKAVCDLSRVLRIPGFTHYKVPDDPKELKLIIKSGKKYTYDEVIRGLPVLPPKPAPNPRKATSEYNIDVDALLVSHGWNFYYEAL